MEQTVASKNSTEVYVVVLIYLWFKNLQFDFKCDNKYQTMKNQNQTGFKNFKAKKNLNHNIYNNFKMCVITVSTARNNNQS